MKQLLTMSWCAYVIVAIATLIYFTPLFQAYPQLVVPSPYPDMLEFVWTAWRMQGVVEGTEDLYHTARVFAPGGASLLLHTVCEGLLLPITWLFEGVASLLSFASVATVANLSPVWRVNVAIVSAFLLNGFAAISFLRSLGVTPGISAVGALLIAFAPNQIGHLTAGHLNFLVLFPLLEVCRFLIICNRYDGETQPSRLDFARAVLAIALMTRTNLYFLYYTVLLSAVCSMWWAWQRQSLFPRIAWAWSAVCLGLMFNAPHLYKIAALARSKRYTPDHDPSTTSADLLAYLVPSSLQQVGLIPEFRQLRSGVGFHEGETSLYIGTALLGALVITFSVAAARRSKEFWFLVVGSCVALLMSLGPYLVFGGVRVGANPFDFILRSVLPLYPSVPARLGVFVGIFIVGVVALGVRLSVSHSKRVLLTSLFTLALVELLPIRCNVTQLNVMQLSPPSPVFSRLRNDAEVSIMVDQPIIAQHAMLRQIIHGKALVGGFLSRRPRKEERELRSNYLLQRIGVSGREHSAEELRVGWCALGADALLLEEPRSRQLKPELLAAGFLLVDEDGAWAVFKPSKEMCRAGGR